MEKENNSPGRGNSSSPDSGLTFLGFELGRPVGKMIERGFVRAVEVEGRHRNGSVENCRIIAFRIEPFDVLLLVQPEKRTAARVGALLKNVARNLLRLAREPHAPIP